MLGQRKSRISFLRTACTHGAQLPHAPTRQQVMVFALKEQNRIIGQLRREANANFMLLDDRSRRTQDLVQKLVGKVRCSRTPWSKNTLLAVLGFRGVTHARGASPHHG